MDRCVGGVGRGRSAWSAVPGGSPSSETDARGRLGAGTGGVDRGVAGADVERPASSTAPTHSAWKRSSSSSGVVPRARLPRASTRASTTSQRGSRPLLNASCSRLRETVPCKDLARSDSVGRPARRWSLCSASMRSLRGPAGSCGRFSSPGRPIAVPPRRPEPSRTVGQHPTPSGCGTDRPDLKQRRSVAPSAGAAWCPGTNGVPRAERGPGAGSRRPPGGGLVQSASCAARRSCRGGGVSGGVASLAPAELSRRAAGPVGSGIRTESRQVSPAAPVSSGPPSACTWSSNDGEKPTQPAWSALRAQSRSLQAIRPPPWDRQEKAPRVTYMNPGAPFQVAAPCACCSAWLTLLRKRWTA